MATLSKTLFSLVYLTAMAAAGPISQRTEAPGHASNQTGAVWMPEMHYIYPQHPDLSKPPVTGLHIETYTNLSQVEQVAVFKGIPAGATDCTLNWSQADKDDRVFILRGSSGLTRMRPLSGLPAGDITFASIQPFDDATQEQSFGPDFTMWDGAQYDQWNHTGGGVDCAPEIYIRVFLRDPLAEASLYMAQDSANGLWIEYTVPE